MTQFRFRTATLVTAGLMFVAGAQAQTMGAAEYKDAKDRIGAQYKASKSACNNLSGNAKDICVEEAKGREKVARAELDHTRSGRAEDLRTLGMVKAETAYDVAKERCDDKTGNDKDVCVKQAKAARVKAEADLKGGRSAAADKADADYQVAAEKCDGLAGDAKSTCLTAAKARFGKS